MDWHHICMRVAPYIVRIETEEGTGTGFLFGYNGDKFLSAVATAAHVVMRAHRWRQPIRLIHHESGKELFLPGRDRTIDVDAARDSASVVFESKAGGLPFPSDTLRLLDATKYKAVGIELAWMGFPEVVYPELCFFKGPVSAFQQDRECYLIDGVAINGVSGGPVFARKEAEGAEVPQLVGTVSAYLSNVQGARTLPGLLRAQDIAPFYKTLQKFKNFDDAKEHEAKQPPAPPEATEKPQGPTPS